MHIPDNYLSPATDAVLGLAMVPVWAYCIRKIKNEIPRDRIAHIGLFAAFSFLLMMFNIPLPGGTTGHAVGGTLIAILLGPHVACIAVSVALLIQALMFGDGGVLAFGANCFNMAFALPFVGFHVYKFIRNRISTPWGDKVGVVVGAYVGINVAAFLAAIQFGIQPLLFTDAGGQALFSPYPLAISIPAMMIPHLLVAGVVEAVATLAIYLFIKRTAPDYIYQPKEGQIRKSAHSKLRPVYVLLGVLIIATPLGLLAQGTAWGEWGSDEIAAVVTNGVELGYTPANLADGWTLEAMMPDYTLGALPEFAAYILSAAIGVAVIIILFKIVGSILEKNKQTGSAA